MIKLFPHQEAALKQTTGMNRVAVKGYEGLYEVDNQGNVFSLVQNGSRRNGVLKQYNNGTGYWKVNLYDHSGKCSKKYVHRLVAEAFVPNPDNLAEVNHIDCDKRNNAVENLEWCSRQRNLNHSYANGLKRTGELHGMHKLTEYEVSEIRNLIGIVPQCEIAKLFGVSQATVSAIKCGRLWKVGDANVKDKAFPPSRGCSKSHRG